MTNDTTRSLGERLRERREELGLGLEQAEVDTRIRRRYLEALETEQYEALPNPVVGRGFLRNYAAYLGLDPEEAIVLYSQRVVPPEVVSLKVDESSPFAADRFEPVPLHEMPGRGARWVWLGLAAVVLVAVLAAGAWWAYPRLDGILSWLGPAAPSATASPTPEPSATERPTLTAMPTLAPTGTASPAPVTPTAPPATKTLRPTQTPSPSPSATAAIYPGVFLELSFVQRSWIRVTVDGVRQEQATLEAGVYRSYYAEQRIEVSLGNAGGVELTLNGEKLGTLGGLGEVVDRVFEKVGGGVLQQTATPAPTPTRQRATTPATKVPSPTSTPAVSTATPLPPTATPLPPTATPLPPTATPLPPTATPLPPIATPGS